MNIQRPVELEKIDNGHTCC